MLEQQANGNLSRRTAYNNVLNICREELNYPFDKDHLKNRMKTLKINFNACHDLCRGLSGFAWSSITKMFEAEPEVWNTLIEAKPHVKKWNDKTIRVVCEGQSYGRWAKEKVQQWEKKGNCNHFVDVKQLDELTSDNYNSSSYGHNSHGKNSSKGIKRKAYTRDTLDKHVEIIQSGINNVAEAIREGNVIAEKGIVASEEREIYAELLNIGVPDDQQLEAFLFLNKYPKKARALFAVPGARRYELLLKMMFQATES